MRVDIAFSFLPTAEARAVLGARCARAASCAFREVAMASRGLELAHIDFAFDELVLSACSRVRADGFVELQVGLGVPTAPCRVFTAEIARRAEERAAERIRLDRVHEREEARRSRLRR